jgi:glycosyltransferase involved in cell wall biosynthesis
MAREFEEAVARLQQQRTGVIWIPTMVPRQTTISLYSHAAVFCCPSIYEPFGLINLEAMACETPVVASAVGGIPEVVVHGETGYLVDPDLSPEPPYGPRHPEQFAQDLATALNRLLADPDLRRRMGHQGRERVEQYYSWRAIAQQTLALYQRLCSSTTWHK